MPDVRFSRVFLLKISEHLSIQKWVSLVGQFRNVKYTCCRYLMLTTPEELHRAAKWPGKGRASRTKLMDVLQGA